MGWRGDQLLHVGRDARILRVNLRQQSRQLRDGLFGRELRCGFILIGLTHRPLDLLFQHRYGGTMLVDDRVSRHGLGGWGLGCVT